MAIVGLIALIIWKIDDSSSFIILYADRIEKKSLFRTRVWRREEVGSLVLDSCGMDYFSIPAGIKRDSAWSEWLRNIPEISKYSASSKGIRISAGIICGGFGALALLMAILSFLNFRDAFIVEHGVSVQGKISSVRNGKGAASGLVEYSLPDGIVCHDWTELGPSGSVQPGDDIIVAVDRACGHPLSRKRLLHPWYYLSIALGIIIAMLYQLRKLKK